jgi:hypothetical protein
MNGKWKDKGKTSKQIDRPEKQKKIIEALGLNKNQ